MSKKELAALTVMLESIFITAALEAKEGSPGAILYAKKEDDMSMTMTRRLAELMVIIVQQIYQK